jgi:acyl carrier protein
VNNAKTEVTRSDVRMTIRDILADRLRVAADSIGDDQPLQDLPGADSVRLLQVVAKIEQRFGLELDDRDIFKPHTLDSLSDLVWTSGRADSDD